MLGVKNLWKVSLQRKQRLLPSDRCPVHILAPELLQHHPNGKWVFQNVMQFCMSLSPSENLFNKFTSSCPHNVERKSQRARATSESCCCFALNRIIEALGCQPSIDETILIWYFFPQFSRDYWKSSALLACFWNCKPGSFFSRFTSLICPGFELQTVQILIMLPALQKQQELSVHDVGHGPFDTYYTHRHHSPEGSACVENWWYFYSCSCPSVSHSSTLLPHHKIKYTFQTTSDNFLRFLSSLLFQTLSSSSIVIFSLACRMLDFICS